MRAHIVQRPWRHLLGAVAVFLGVLILVLPSPYVVQSPGPTQDVLGRRGGSAVIAVTGVRTHTDSGKLLMVTVNASGVPGYPVTNAQALWGWLDPDLVVTPQEAVFPPGQSAKEYEQQSSDEMSGSQSTARQVALTFAKTLGVDVAAAKVTMHIDQIGGPSAGMMYTLGTIDKLTEANESGGAVIAGTGTIESDGTVGAIGGIRLKMLGAKRDGATWFLAPKSNCNEVIGHIPSGLQVVRVTDISDAYSSLVAIGNGRGAGLPQCTTA